MIGKRLHKAKIIANNKLSSNPGRWSRIRCKWTEEKLIKLRGKARKTNPYMDWSCDCERCLKIRKKRFLKKISREEIDDSK